MKVVASLSQGRTAAAQCGLFTYKSVPVILEPLCISAVASAVLMYAESLRCWAFDGEIRVGCVCV